MHRSHPCQALGLLTWVTVCVNQVGSQHRGPDQRRGHRRSGPWAVAGMSIQGEQLVTTAITLSVANALGRYASAPDVQAEPGLETRTKVA